MVTVAALYHFTRFDDPAALKPPLATLCCAAGRQGHAVAGARGDQRHDCRVARRRSTRVLAHIRALPGCAGLEWKESHASEMPFVRMKVRVKREIVTMGQPDVDPLAAVGRYVQPADWNALIDAPDVAVIDTRNDYEVAIGSFDGAVDPGTRSLRRVSRLVGGEQAPVPQQAHRDVLHRRHPVREIDELPDRAGGGRGLSPEGRHPEIP